MPESLSISSLLTRAETWAASLWDAARGRWSGREDQDRNYRLHVVHPSMRAVLRENFPEGGIRALDLGCGDGSFLDDPGNRALLRGGSYLGVDISPELIGQAEASYGDPGFAFREGDLSDPETAAHILRGGRTWNNLFSVFVIQEVPDIDAFLSNLAGVAAPGSLAVVVTVHPEFALWLRETGVMEEADGLDGYGRNVSWNWAGRYPIVDDHRAPFHLPYFHRSEEDYRDAFHRAGFRIREMRGIPEADDLVTLREKKISPFFSFLTNCYWPRIAEGPSALIITASREDRHGE